MMHFQAKIYIINQRLSINYSKTCTKGKQKSCRF